MPTFDVQYKIGKFVEGVWVSRPLTGEMLYYSNKLSQANGSTSVSMGEIRAGVGNRIVAIISSDPNATVEVNDVNMSLLMRALQVGGRYGYGFPTPVCAVLTAANGKITIDPSANGTPIAGPGYSSAFAIVQKTGEKSTIESDGTPYAINSTTYDVTGFPAVNGSKYKVWYWVNSPTTEYAVVQGNIDPAIVNLRLAYPVFANVKEDDLAGSRIGTLYAIYPFLKLNGAAGIDGNGSGNSTTSLSGTAISYEDTTVSETCDNCSNAAGDLVYYLYVPCSGGDSAIDGLFLVGGEAELPVNTSKKLNFQLMVNGSPTDPDPAMMTYAASGLPTGTTVSETGVVTAGSTAGSGTVTATYTRGTASWSCPVTVTVESA